MPLALWCVLAAGILPIVTVGLAKWGAPDFDNGDPRGWSGGLKGWRARAFAAHQNGFEVFPFFAAAVLAAATQGTATGTVGLLAAAFVVSRLAYVWAYVADRPTVRSAIWSVGFFLTVAIFTAPAWS